MDARNERHKHLAQLNLARTGELEATMEAALITRTAMITDLERACQVLSGYAATEKPNVSYLRKRVDYLTLAQTRESQRLER